MSLSELPARAPAPRPISTQPDAALTTLKVFIEGLRVDAEVGVYAEEHHRRQPLILDIEVELRPAFPGELNATADYDWLAGQAKAVAAEGHIELVETFASQVASRCLRNPQTQSARVKVRKPEAMADGMAGAEVTMERR